MNQKLSLLLERKNFLFIFLLFIKEHSAIRGAFFCILFALSACGANQQIQTLTPGVLTVAVTSGAPTNEYDSQLWIRRYVQRMSSEFDLTVSWVVVPFNESWLLASNDEVDLVATNVASFSDRAHARATFSSPFLYERRALRIRPEDQERYQHIDDFSGKTVGVVSGMAAARDVNRRAPNGVIVRTTNTFAELYAEFDAGQLDAIAEAEYYSLDGEIIPSHGDDVVLIDHHDLTPGQREESVFVVRDSSQNLLAAVNAFVARTRFPL
jgi:ABC-type amino acid transport substrate-binding protein